MARSNYHSNTAVKRANCAELLPVEQVLANMLRRHGLDRKIARYRFVTHWEEIVGEEIARHASPECFRNSALVVRVSSSVWAQELSFQKNVILRRLRNFIADDQVVDDVVFYVAGGK